MRGTITVTVRPEHAAVAALETRVAELEAERLAGQWDANLAAIAEPGEND